MYQIMIETEPFLFCDDCAKSFISFADLEPVEYIHIADRISKDLVCDMCGRKDGWVGNASLFKELVKA